MLMRSMVVAVMGAVLGGVPAMTFAADAPGLKPGAKAPAFKLKDQAGKERSLESLLEKGSVALVFYRSASW